MSDDSKILKKGTIIDFETGEYSDRCVTEPFIVLKDFIYIDEAKKFWKEYAENLYKENNSVDYEWDYISDELDQPFITYLIKNEFIEPCDSTRIYIGAYEFFDADDWFDDFKKEKTLFN